MSRPSPARVVIEVRAGVIPGQPEEEFTKRFVATADDLNNHNGLGTRLMAFNRRALDYQAELMMMPHRLNWVQAEWLWL